MPVDVEQMRSEVEEKSSPGDLSTISPARFASRCQPVPAVILDARVKWGADVAGGDSALEFSYPVIVSECECDLVNFSAYFCSFEHVGRFVVIHREGLFAEDMLAMIQRHDRLAGVSRIGAGDRDGVDVWIGAKGLEVIGRVRNAEFGSE